jgi:hypothetical protein
MRAAAAFVHSHVGVPGVVDEVLVVLAVVLVDGGRPPLAGVLVGRRPAVVVGRVGVALLVLAVVGVGGAGEAHGGAVGVVGGAAAEGPGARGPGGGGGGGGGRGGGRRRAAEAEAEAGVHLVGDPDGPAARLPEAVGVREQREDAVGAALHAGAPVEALVVDVVEAPEVVHGGHVRPELEEQVLGAVREQELEDDERLVHGAPLLPVGGAAEAVVEDLGDPPAVVHVEGGIGDAGKRLGVGDAGVVVGGLLNQPAQARQEQDHRSYTRLIDRWIVPSYIIYRDKGTESYVQLCRRDVAQRQPRLLVLVLQEPRGLPLHLAGEQLPPRRARGHALLPCSSCLDSTQRSIRSVANAGAS